MSNSEIKILRDELVKVIAEIQKMCVLNGKLTHALEERDRIVTEMMMENDSFRRHLKIYENPHAPPSHGSVPAYAAGTDTTVSRMAAKRTILMG